MNVTKKDLKKLKKKSKPIATLQAGEMVLGTDSKHINPIRKLSDKKPKTAILIETKDEEIARLFLELAAKMKSKARLLTEVEAKQFETSGE